MDATAHVCIGATVSRVEETEFVFMGVLATTCRPVFGCEFQLSSGRIRGPDGDGAIFPLEWEARVGELV